VHIIDTHKRSKNISLHFIFSILVCITLCFAACGGDPEDTHPGSSGNNASSQSGASSGSQISGQSSTPGNDASDGSSESSGQSSTPGSGESSGSQVSGQSSTPGSGASGGSSESSSIPSGATQGEAIPLTANAWGNGNLTTGNSVVQWFSFTATAATQYIHAAFSTLSAANGVRIQVYTGTGSAVGDEAQLNSSTMYVSRALTSGQTYYIQVQAHTSGNTGTYQIGFNTTFVPPGVIDLTADVWGYGNLAAASAVQWFRFTATAATQYIYAAMGTLNSANGVSIQVYDGTGTTVWASSQLNSVASVSRSLTVNQTYYIQVKAYTATNTGTYQIGFNAVSFPPPGVTELTANTWGNGSFAAAGEVQWYRFTANSSTQYIHAAMGTLTAANGVYVQVYTSTGTTVGTESQLNSSTAYVSRMLTSGQTYYIRVRAYTGANTGTYQIGFNASSVLRPGETWPPESITLTANAWGDGNLASAGAVQWFSFTANSSTQYIHAAMGTLNSANGVSIQVYTGTGTTVGNESQLNSSTAYVSRTLTSGQTYYIRVQAYTSANIGTYQIAFNTTFVPPGVIELAANAWSDGNLAAASAVQWFRFTATAVTQLIHIEAGTLNYPYIQVYDSAGSTVGGAAYITAGTPASRALTVGQEYYIRVWPYSGYTGTYRIAFNTTIIPPGVIELTLNVWGNGNLTTGNSGVQWFSFTANSSTQYIHAAMGTLNASNGVSIQVFDSIGTAVVGSESQLNSGTMYVSRTLTSGQTYYIRARAYTSGNTGTYQIGFTPSIWAPGVFPPTTVTTLTENVWGDGNLASAGAAQWFDFTATASTQYFHVTPGTLPYGVSIQIYDDAGTAVASASFSGSTLSASCTLTSGQTYYIRVLAYTGSDTGTYQIGFNTSTLQPGEVFPPVSHTPLTVNTWENGNLAAAEGVQWFSFTATAATQYIRAAFTSLSSANGVVIQVYDSVGAAIGARSRLYGGILYVSRALTVQTYYIRVWAYDSANTGTYQMMFSAASPSALFISEYCEGSGNNRYIEIYNPGSSAVNLSGWSLASLNSFDTAKPTDVSYVLNLSGNLPANSCYVVANASAVTEVITAANTRGTVITYSATDPGGRIASFTGYRVIVLYQGDMAMDSVGTIGNGETLLDMTLVRKPDKRATLTFDMADWTQYAQDTVSNVGIHTP
jgi:hypothetical protein